MSTGSVPMSETGPPEGEGPVGPLVTSRVPRHVDTPAPGGRVGPFRVGSPSDASPERVLSVGQMLSSRDDGVDEPSLPPVRRPAPAPKLPETVPAFGATDLPDPWESYLSSGGRPRTEPRREDGAPGPTARGEAAAARPAEPTPDSRSPAPAPRLVGDPGRSEEVAARLESIARAIREGGPAGALTDLPDDPLAAMVAGYLLGFSSGGPTGTRTPAG